MRYRKTLAAYFIHEKRATRRTLVLVPSLPLLAQTLREWTTNTKAGFDFLPVVLEVALGSARCSCAWPKRSRPPPPNS